MVHNINGIYLNDLYPTSRVAGAIDIFENCWENPEDSINMIEESCTKDEGMFWKKAETIGSGVEQNIRTNKFMDLTEKASVYNNFSAQQVHNKFYSLILSSFIPYTHNYGLDFMLENIEFEGFGLLKYESNEMYGSHFDGDSKSGREFSIICYLNDNYVGGEIEFPNFDLKIKPTAGTMMIFPSNYPYRHIAHPVSSGSKYAILTWAVLK